MMVPQIYVHILIPETCVYSSILAVVNTTMHWVAYKQQKFISPSSVGWEDKDQGSGRGDVLWGPGSLVIDDVFL
jgi:hypothetical protein